MNKNLKSVELFLSLGLVAGIGVANTAPANALEGLDNNSWQIEQESDDNFILIAGGEGAEGGEGGEGTVTPQDGETINNIQEGGEGTITPQDGETINNIQESGEGTITPQDIKIIDIPKNIEGGEGAEGGEGGEGGEG